MKGYKMKINIKTDGEIIVDYQVVERDGFTTVEVDSDSDLSRVIGGYYIDSIVYLNCKKEKNTIVQEIDSYYSSEEYKIFNCVLMGEKIMISNNSYIRQLLKEQIDLMSFNAIDIKNNIDIAKRNYQKWDLRGNMFTRDPLFKENEFYLDTKITLTYSELVRIYSALTNDIGILYNARLDLISLINSKNSLNDVIAINWKRFLDDEKSKVIEINKNSIYSNL